MCFDMLCSVVSCCVVVCCVVSCCLAKTSTDESKIVQDDDKESDEVIKEYIGENYVVEI